MEIRHSTEADLGRIMEIYEYARIFMAEHGNPYQWGPTNQPPKQLIQRDISCGTIYVGEDPYPRMAYEKVWFPVY